MKIVTVWTSSDSYIEILIDDKGNVIGILHGGNRGPAYLEEARKKAGEPIRVESDTSLHDAANLFINEIRRFVAAA